MLHVLISFLYNHLLWHDTGTFQPKVSWSFLLEILCPEGFSAIRKVTLKSHSKWARWPHAICLLQLCPNWTQTCHFYPHLIFSLYLGAMLGDDMAQFNIWIMLRPVHPGPQFQTEEDNWLCFLYFQILMEAVVCIYWTRCCITALILVRFWGKRSS